MFTARPGRCCSAPSARGAGLPASRCAAGVQAATGSCMPAHAARRQRWGAGPRTGACQHPPTMGAAALCARGHAPRRDLPHASPAATSLPALPQAPACRRIMHRRANRHGGLVTCARARLRRGVGVRLMPRPGQVEQLRHSALVRPQAQRRGCRHARLDRAPPLPARLPARAATPCSPLRSKLHHTHTDGPSTLPASNRAPRAASSRQLTALLQPRAAARPAGGGRWRASSRVQP